MSRRTLLVAGILGAALGAAHAPGALAEEGGASPALYDDAVVRDISLTFASDDWIALLGCGRGAFPGLPSPNPEDVPARLEVDGTVLEDVGVRCKGNSSLGIANSKKPLNITTDAFVDGQELWGFDIVNLNNNWSDPSQIREAMILRLIRDYAPVSRSGFARLTVQGRTIGLYTMVEQIDRQFADTWFPDDDGLVIKGDSPIRIAFNTSSLTWEGEELDAYKRNYEAKGRAADDDAAYEALRELVRALDAPESAGGLDASGFPDGVRRVLDVESALWYLAASNLLANFDSYYAGKNYYLYLGQRDPRFHLVTWDTGLGFGIFGLLGSSSRPGASTPSARVSPYAQESDAGRPLVRRLLAVPSFRADYIAHYRTLYEEAFTTAAIEALGERYQALIREAVRDEVSAQGNVSGSFTYDQFLANLRENVTRAGSRPGAMGAPGIVGFAAERRAYLATLPELGAPDVELASLRHVPERPTAADAVDVRAEFAGRDAVTDVELRYRVDGGLESPVPMRRQDGGSWRAAIPAQSPGRVVGYVVRAATGTGVGDVRFFPGATLTRPYTYTVAGVQLPEGVPGDIVMNELMADNATTIVDEAGEHDDWIELVNRGTEPVSLDGLFLSDDETDPWVYALPATTLAPGEHLLVWCDNDPEQGDLHADFRLSKDGESVHLSTREERLETITYEALAPDAARMRLPDGTGEWITCEHGTPGEANRCDAEAPTPAGSVTPTLTPTVTTTRTPEIEPSSAPGPAWSVWLPIAGG